jgi:hypothetical protein
VTGGASTHYLNDSSSSNVARGLRKLGGENDNTVWTKLQGKMTELISKGAEEVEDLKDGAVEKNPNYYWYYGFGEKWVLFDDANAAKIEDAFLKVKKRVFVVDREHYVDFSDMKLKRSFNDYARRVMRVEEPLQDETRELEQFEVEDSEDNNQQQPLLKKFLLRKQSSTPNMLASEQEQVEGNSTGISILKKSAAKILFGEGKRKATLTEEELALENQRMLQRMAEGRGSAGSVQQPEAAAEGRGSRTTPRVSPRIGRKGLSKAPSKALPRSPRDRQAVEEEEGGEEKAEEDFKTFTSNLQISPRLRHSGEDGVSMGRRRKAAGAQQAKSWSFSPVPIDASPKSLDPVPIDASPMDKRVEKVKPIGLAPGSMEFVDVEAMDLNKSE